MNKTDVYSFRMDNKLIDTAKRKGINIKQLLEIELMKITGLKKCPTCAQKIVTKRKKKTKVAACPSQ